jgi:hypothetical protein
VELDTVLGYHNINLKRGKSEFWEGHGSHWATVVNKNDSPETKFALNMAVIFGSNRLISRNEGEWTNPWPSKVLDRLVMPKYDPYFSKTYEQVTDERALEIKQRINEHDHKFAVMYSGGMDSTNVLCALLKNLTPEEMRNVSVATSIHAIIESPVFFKKHIHGKLNVIDSDVVKYDHMIEQGYYPITGDEGDGIFGTHAALQMYHNYDALTDRLSGPVKSNLRALKYKVANGDVSFKQYKDLLIAMFTPYDTDEGRMFGHLLYSKIVHNIETQQVPVHSLHDFWWWEIFNLKSTHCSVRCSVFNNDSLTVGQALDHSVNWYNSTDYQLWSMVNNNNGTKIQGDINTYKYVQRQYIKEFTGDDWYFHFKTKLESLNNIIMGGGRNETQVAVDHNYKKYSSNDKQVLKYFRYHMENFKFDWPIY